MQTGQARVPVCVYVGVYFRGVWVYICVCECVCVYAYLWIQTLQWCIPVDNTCRTSEGNQGDVDHCIAESIDSIWKKQGGGLEWWSSRAWMWTH